MASLSDRHESLKSESINPFWTSMHDKKRNRGMSSSEQLNQDDHSQKDAKNKLSNKLPPIRKNRVEEAKRKRENGEYDTQEVYRKIAERLIDSFGI